MKGFAFPFGWLVVVVFALGVAVVPDPVSAQGGPECTIVGTEGPDVLEGGPGVDVICGLGGDDVISGGSGSDIIYGGEGNDIIDAGSGADTVYAGDGDDVVDGRSGADVVAGGSGNDVLSGSSGSDDITGGRGADELFGGSGRDDLKGGPGVDSADGGSGSDTCAAETVVSCETVNPDEGGVAPATVTVDTPGEGQTVFAETQVSVTVEPADATGTVEVSVGGVSVGSSAIVDGAATVAWDTTTSADGEAVLLAEARDESGAVTATSSISVIVDNALDSYGRIQADGEAGVLSVDEYVEYGVLSLTNPELLPPQYLGGAGAGAEDPVDSGSGLGVWFMAPWPATSTETQARLTEFLSVREVDVVLPQTTSRLQQQQANTTWPECNEGPEVLPVWAIVGKAFRCVHNVDVDGTTVFEVYYTVEGLDDPSLADLVSVAIQGSGWAETVSDTDTDGNGVPDVVERVARSLVESWEAYTALGYPTPTGLPIGVAMHDPNGPAPGSPGVVLPPVVAGGPTLVQLSNSQLFDYLPRHELYHLFQYQYVGLFDFGVDNILVFCGPPFILCGQASRQMVELNWFQELSAEWATHQVQEWHADRGTPVAGQLEMYAFNLPAWFSALDDGLVAWGGLGFGDEQYGSFTLAEFLEERFPTVTGDPNPSVVRQVWERLAIAPSSAVSAVGAVVESNGETWETFLPAYAQANYTVASPDPTRPYRDDDAAPVWRDLLENTAFPTAGTFDPIGSTGVNPAALGLNLARPARIIEPLQSDIVATGQVEVGPGGMVYVELIPPDGFSGSIAVQASGVSSAVDVQAMSFGVYPELCAVPDPLTGAGGVVTGEFLIDGSCRFVTLVVTNTEPSGGTVSVGWEAALLAEGNLLVNPGFETGDFTGWVTFDDTTPNHVWFGTETGNGFFDPVEGTYAASVTSLDGIGPAGFDQQVTVVPGQSYQASVQVGKFEGFFPSAALEIIDETGTVIASDTVDFGLIQEWRLLATSFVAPADTVTMRLAWTQYLTGESSTIWFDDARLEVSDEPANLAFEAGTLNGWTADPVNLGTVFEVRADGQPDALDPYAAHMIIPGTAFGSEQLTRTVYSPGNAEAAVLVSGTAGAVAILEVIHSGGMSVDSVTLTGSGNWIRLSVLADFNDPVTIRLIGDRGAAPTGVDIVFDGVYVSPSG